MKIVEAVDIDSIKLYDKRTIFLFFSLLLKNKRKNLETGKEATVFLMILTIGML